MVLLIQCVVCCLLFTVVILPVQYKDPLSMIMSYPPEIIKRVEQLPQYKGMIQKREAAHIKKKVIGVVFFVILLAVLAYCSGCRSFYSVFLHVFTLFLVVNMYDMLILDWGIFCHSKRLQIPGTEDMEDVYKNKWFHLRGAIIGTVLGLVVATASGGMVHIFMKI